MANVTLYHLFPPQLRRRIVLDYPLDVLLNRACKLQDYAEKDLYGRTLGLVQAAKRLLRDGEEDAVQEVVQHPPWSLSAEERARHAQQGGLVPEYFEQYERFVGKDPDDPRQSEITGRIGSLVIPADPPPEAPQDGQATPDRGAKGMQGGIDAASGNILIRGKPGTCKTTLALQCALRCTRAPNHYSAVFVSLEENSERILEKCRIMGWHKDAKEKDGVIELRGLQRLDNSSSTEELAKTLADMLKQADGPGPTNQRVREGKVVLPMLSPRSIRRADSRALFQKRYEQLERLLGAFRWLRRDRERFADLPDLRVLCIDSLSALADRPLNREEIYRVFDLFTTYGVIGIVTVEAEDRRTADSLADVIIELHSDQDDGYSLRYLEISKSRHQHQVYGLHPFVVRHSDDYHEERGDTLNGRATQRPSPEDFFQALMVYPSIHYLTYSTRQPQAGAGDPIEFANFDIGIEGLERVLTGGLLKRRSIVTVKGPRGTYKSHIARNFLLSGLAKGESVILVHLGATSQFNPAGWANHRATPWLTSPEVQAELLGSDSTSPDQCILLLANERFELLANNGEPRNDTGIESRNTSKFRRDIWRYKNPDKNYPILIEFDFKPGALLPEQFLKHVRDVFRQRQEHVPKLRRMVLDDVSLIGTSYPRLRQSRTVGDLFLTAFVHFARYYGLDVIMVGTSGEFAEADAVVRRASTLADSVLTCDFCDVFGDRLISVTGDGLMISHSSKSDQEKQKSPPQRKYGEFVPGVVMPLSAYRFTVDLNKLEGLVGFETSQIHRPGVVVNLFSEGNTLSRYNGEIRTLLECAFASPGERRVRETSKTEPGTGDTNVVVREFGWDKSTALHDSLQVLRGNPVDKTVVCALDEFFLRRAGSPAELPASAGRSSGLGTLLEQYSFDPRPDSRAVFSWQNFRKEVWPDEVIQGKEPVAAAPYYSNVLMIAYHAALEDVLAGCWVTDERLRTRRLKSWEMLLAALQKGKPAKWLTALTTSKRRGVVGIGSQARWARKDDWRAFESGDPSAETLSCIVLDAIAARRPNASTMRELVESSAELSNVADELLALSELCRYGADGSTRDRVSKRENRRLAELGRDVGDSPRLTRIYPYAGVYVVWYTQIRELIADYPELASCLRVAALPGRGVRGDWYLGVANGSVSVALGQRIIQILCGRDEDNRRFIEGVGLPTHRDYDIEGIYMAWPRAEVDLADVLEIHRYARARSGIGGYAQVRATLGALGEQVRIALDDTSSHREAISGFLSRLGVMVDLVTGTGASRPSEPGSLPGAPVHGQGAQRRSGSMGGPRGQRSHPGRARRHR